MLMIIMMKMLLMTTTMMMIMKVMVMMMMMMMMMIMLLPMIIKINMKRTTIILMILMGMILIVIVYWGIFLQMASFSAKNLRFKILALPSSRHVDDNCNIHKTKADTSQCLRYCLYICVTLEKKLEE